LERRRSSAQSCDRKTAQEYSTAQLLAVLIVSRLRSLSANDPRRRPVKLADATAEICIQSREVERGRVGSVDRKHQQRGGKSERGEEGTKGGREELRIIGGGDSSDQYLLQIQQLQLLKLKEKLC